MRFGVDTGRIEATFNPFLDEYLAEILEAVAIAWARMKCPKSSEIEDRITFRLAGRLLNDPHFRDLPYDIVPQYWLLDLDGRRLGRLDLRFKHRQSQRDYFALESKRLHVTYPGGSVCTEYSAYTGSEGMMAFVEQQYSKGLAVAGMLGYVMDGDCDRAWAGLEKHIGEKCTVLCVVADSKLTKSALAGAVANGLTGTLLGETQHNLKTQPLRLFHVLLPLRRATNPKLN